MCQIPLNSRLSVALVIWWCGFHFRSASSSFYQRNGWITGRANYLTGRKSFESCTNFCLDKAACEMNGCHYDPNDFHCFQSSEVAAAQYKIDPADILDMCKNYCSNSTGCNEQMGCFYDTTVHHCVSTTNWRKSCQRFDGKKNECSAGVCDFCCRTATCLPRREDSTCSIGCAPFCHDPIECRKHGCNYNSVTGMCEEKEKTCEHLVNSAHDSLENCLACTGSKCAYIVDTQPQLCRPVERVDGRKWGEGYYTQAAQCQSDCNLHLIGETESECLGCLRSGQCVLKYEACKTGDDPPKCVSKANLTSTILKPGETILSEPTACQKICEELDSDPIKCRNSGCNFCCSTGDCYAAHEKDTHCPTGCGSLCYLEDECLANGCYFDQDTNECLDNRTACHLFNGEREMCEARGCDYCCKAMICFPGETTGVDTTPAYPEHLVTSPGCCEGGPSRFKSSCFLETEGHHVAGRGACLAGHGVYTGNFFTEKACPHNHYKYECTRAKRFWSNCIFGGRDIRTIAEASCMSIFSTFRNAVSSTTCPAGFYRFLCGNAALEEAGSGGVQINPGDPRVHTGMSELAGRYMTLAGSLGADRARSMIDRPFHPRHSPVMETLPEYRKRIWNTKVIRGKRDVSSRVSRISHVEPRTYSSPRCSAYCLDAGLCKLNNCVYDYKNMHCVDQSQPGVLSFGVSYPDEVPQTWSNCKNVGGHQHTDIWGFDFESDISTQTSQNLGIHTYPLNTVVTGIDTRDVYLHTTERRTKTLRYRIKLYRGSGHFQFRLHFTELQYNTIGRRPMNIKINGRFVKQNWDMFTEFGTGVAIVLDFGCEVENGMLKLNGMTSRLNGDSVLVEILIVNRRSSPTAQCNAICSTRMPACTSYCHDPVACNAVETCFYDLATKHCIPNDNLRTACERLAKDKPACLQQGCQFCCKSETCHLTLPEDNVCNEGCEQFCYEKDKCVAAANCKYLDDTNICEEKMTNCVDIIAMITDRREQCLACVLGECSYIIQENGVMCADRSLPISSFDMVKIYYNTSTSCEHDPGLSNMNANACHDKGFRYCCETMTCHAQDDTEWSCTNGCSQWCYDEQNCTDHHCYYDLMTGECKNTPFVWPCDKCDICDRRVCEAAQCWWHDMHNMCFNETGSFGHNQTTCEANSGKYCPCGIPSCIPEDQDCTLPTTDAECEMSGCLYDCETKTCSDEMIIQVAFVVDININDTINKLKEFASSVIESMFARYPALHVGITTHADWDGESWNGIGSPEHKNKENGCYRLVIPFTRNTRVLELEALNMVSLHSRPPANSISALAWASVDTSIGWLSRNPKIKKVLWLMTDTTDNGDNNLAYPGNRGPSRLDGTDTCLTSSPVRYHQAREVFARNRNALFATFFNLRWGLIHQRWQAYADNSLRMPFAYHYDDAEEDDIIEQFHNFIHSF